MQDATTTPYPATIGLDVSDRFTTLCELDASGEIVETGKVRTTAEALTRRFGDLPRTRVVLEVGTHSPWMSRLLAEHGHEVIVANARRVKAIWAAENKSDDVDAEALARLGRSDPRLLHPVRHRGPRAQAHRSIILSRTKLSQVRASLVTHARGLVKAFGARLPQCGTSSFPHRAASHVPEELRPALAPILETIRELSRKIRAYDKQLEELIEQEYPEAQAMRRIRGVGVVTSLMFVLTIEDPDRFAKSRQVGPYVGMRPKRAQSGEWDPALRITKTGDRELRRLLVNASQYILGAFGEDCDLRRFGKRIEARGGKASKQRAVVAVARKLAVQLHRIWVTGVDYEPLYQASRAE